MTTRYQGTIDSETVCISYSYSDESTELQLSFAFARGWSPMKVTLSATADERRDLALALRAVARGLEADSTPASQPRQPLLPGIER